MDNLMRLLCEEMAKEAGGEVVRYIDSKCEVVARYKVENYPYAIANRRVVKVDIKTV